jgi:hypothetical protein
MPSGHEIVAHLMPQKDEDNRRRISRASNDQCGGHCQNEKNDMEDISSHENNYFFFL